MRHKRLPSYLLVAVFGLLCLIAGLVTMFTAAAQTPEERASTVLALLLELPPEAVVVELEAEGWLYHEGAPNAAATLAALLTQMPPETAVPAWISAAVALPSPTPASDALSEPPVEPLPVTEPLPVIEVPAEPAEPTAVIEPAGLLPTEALPVLMPTAEIPADTAPLPDGLAPLPTALPDGYIPTAPPVSLDAPLPAGDAGATPLPTALPDGLMPLPTALPEGYVLTLQAPTQTGDSSSGDLAAPAAGIGGLDTASSLMPGTAAPIPAAVSPTPAAVAAAALGQISGAVLYPQGGSAAGIGLRLRLPDGKVIDAPTGAEGDFLFSGLTPGAYVLEAIMPGYLPLRAEFALQAGQNLALPTATLRVGDTNGDGLIDLTDAALIAANFGGPALVAAADLNRDGWVDVRDLALVGAQFGLSGPVAWR